MPFPLFFEAFSPSSVVVVEEVRVGSDEACRTAGASKRAASAPLSPPFVLFTATVDGATFTVAASPCIGCDMPVRFDLGSVEGA